MKLSAGESWEPHLQTLRCCWPSAAVHHQCPRPGNRPPEDPIRDNEFTMNDFLQQQLTMDLELDSLHRSGLTSCSCAASIKMVPTPHMGSTTQEPGCQTEVMTLMHVWMKLSDTTCCRFFFILNSVCVFNSTCI